MWTRTTRANRFAKTYGMKIISPLSGAPRVEILSLDRIGAQDWSWASVKSTRHRKVGPHAATQGLDDCPSSQETKQLALLGIQPMIIFDLKADLEFCLERLSWDVRREESVNFSVNLLSQRYEKWQEDQASFRDWQRSLQVGGLCPVTYVDDLPDCKLMEQGRADLGAIFKDEMYLFCSEKFLAQPYKYTEMDIPPLRFCRSKCCRISISWSKR